MSGWNEFSLGQLVEILSSKRVFASDYVSNGVPFWRGKEVVELSAGRSISTELFISEETYQFLGRKVGFPKTDDILLTSVGTLGRAYKLTDEDRIYFKDGNLTWFRNYSERIDPSWLLYWMRSEVGQQAFEQTKIGSTQQALTIVNLKALRILLPSLHEQIEIAAILSALDDKIELNRKTAATLEEMARALYRSWFVDFDPVHARSQGLPPAHMPPTTAALFPNSFGEDGLPEGWVLTRAEDVALKIAMGPFGSNIKVSTFVEKGVPIISGHHLHGTLLKQGKHKFITEEHADRLKNSNVFEGDIVFTHAGTIGQVSMIGPGSSYERFVISQRQFFLRPDKSKVSPLFLLMYFKSSRGQHELLSNASQVGVPSIARPSSHLKAIQICLPSINAMAAFEEKVSTIVQKMSAIEQENQTLATLRDTLLPRLMSGELRVGDARERVEDVA